jgi:GntR family transcriptional regulator
MDTPLVQFDVNPSSGVPIYRQLIDQVYALIAGGKLQSGDLLPSVRQVAQTAAINPMTVSKAYSRLEAEGLVERVRGTGMKITATGVTGTLRERRKQFRQMVEPAIHRAQQLGLSPEEIRKVLDTLLAELPQETLP